MKEQDSTHCPAEEDEVFRFTSASPVPPTLFVVAVVVVTADVVLKVSTRQWKLALVQLHLKFDHEGI